MPELPEVESTARFLHERIAGDEVSSVSVLWQRTVGDERTFTTALTGAVVRSVFRRAKFVCFDCVDSVGAPFVVAAHMRMSGSFDVVNSNTLPEKHDRFLWRLRSGKTVTFCDPRKFGRASIERDFEIFSRRLGIEPLTKEFTPFVLLDFLARKRPIKSLLLDQKLISGLGNIYVDEALWHAQIHPMRRADRVPMWQVPGLHAAIQYVLQCAITMQGTDFGDGVFEMGSYQPVAYGRTGEPCKRCATQLQRIIVGQRSSHFCPYCQPRVGQKNLDPKKAFNLRKE